MTKITLPIDCDRDEAIAALRRRVGRAPDAIGSEQIGELAAFYHDNLDPETATAAQTIAGRLAAPSIDARALVVQTAQSAVGVRYDQLTAAQVRALFAIILWESGGLSATGQVRPLAAWVRD